MDDAGNDWRRTWHGVREVFGRKWALHVLRALDGRPRGFNDLKRTLDGVTAKTLSARLSELRCAGFVERAVEPTSPPSTTYRLTPAGRAVADLLAELESMAEPVEFEGSICCATVGERGGECGPAC